MTRLVIVYTAGVTGLLKSFVDVVDDDLVIATPVVLAATAGTERHAVVVDDLMRLATGGAPRKDAT